MKNMSEIIKIIDGYKIIEYEKTNIYVIENILDDEFCNTFIDIIDTIPLSKEVYKPGNNVKCHYAQLDNLMDINDSFYYKFSTDDNKFKKLLNNKIPSTNKLNGILKNQIKNYCDLINNKMLLINEVFLKINDSFSLEYNSGYILRKIYGKTRRHADGIPNIQKSNITFIADNKDGIYNMIRNASIIFTLNDNYDGGIFRFPYHDVSLKLKKGSVIIFPPFWTHPHESDYLENNTYRYTITTWSCIKL